MSLIRYNFSKKQIDRFRDKLKYIDFGPWDAYKTILGIMRIFPQNRLFYVFTEPFLHVIDQKKGMILSWENFATGGRLNGRTKMNSYDWGKLG